MAFAALHHVLISDIWFSLAPMLIAGAVCGASLGWSYAVLFESPAVSTWVLYNAVYLAVLVLLGIASFLLYDPITTTAAVIAADEPLGELIARALPLTAFFTLGSVAVISALWGRSLKKAAAIFLTCTILVALFGLNISVIGLVEMSGEDAHLVAIFFGLIVAIIAGNTAVFALLERRGLFMSSGAAEAQKEPVQDLATTPSSP
ncbi:MAG TPA: hypothetical protein VMN60_08545 [Longimicrobiales bacterium]|nr:hypothetical protein [Longimicrobiales bacterium]